MSAALVSIDAKVEPASLFSDNMVLQQQTEAAIWGKARPDAKVVITPSWPGKKVVVKAGEDGKWFARVSTPMPGGPYELKLDDGEKTILKNILIGEVWICSGQSNMAMLMLNSTGFEQEKQEMPNKKLRVFIIKVAGNEKPQSNCTGAWYIADEKRLGSFSAVRLFCNAACIGKLHRLHTAGGKSFRVSTVMNKLTKHANTRAVASVQYLFNFGRCALYTGAKARVLCKRYHCLSVPSSDVGSLSYPPREIISLNILSVAFLYSSVPPF